MYDVVAPCPLYTLCPTARLSAFSAFLVETRNICGDIVCPYGNRNTIIYYTTCNTVSRCCRTLGASKSPISGCWKVIDYIKYVNRALHGASLVMEFCFRVWSERKFFRPTRICEGESYTRSATFFLFFLFHNVIEFLSSSTS